MALRINQRDEGSVTILDLSGKVAGAAGESLADRVEGLIGGGRNRLILNLGGRVPHRQRGAQLAAVDAQRRRWRGRPSSSSSTSPSGSQDLIVTTKLEMVFDSFESEGGDAIQSFS